MRVGSWAFSRRLMSSKTRNTNFWKGPVSWTSLGLVAIVGGALSVYYVTEKDRKTRSGNN